MRFDASEYVPQDITPVKAGSYTFTVIGAVEGQSKHNNDMISLELQVDVPGRDNPVKVYDYLVSVPKALFKIKQFCDSVELNFEVGNLEADGLIGLTGTARFRMGLPKDNGKRYLEVQEYLPVAGFSEQPKANQATTPAGQQPATAGAAQTTTQTPPNDDIPF
jgi:hypothetical protein